MDSLRYYQKVLIYDGCFFEQLYAGSQKHASRPKQIHKPLDILNKE